MLALQRPQSTVNVVPAANPHPVTTYHAAPQDFGKKITITQQTCLVEEKFSKNGVQKDVHVVVKNNPFVLSLALLDKQFNFHNVTPEVQLVYDCATLKEVDFVKLKPLECKTRPNDEGDQLTIELRIKVLTSQLEDMFFRVVIKFMDPRTRKEVPQLVCLSHPIRVVSKPDQVKKKIKKRKRAPTDSLLDSINRIEHQQREQQRLLKRLRGDAPSPDDQSEGVPSPTDISSGEEDEEESKDDFRAAFSDFLSAFKLLQNVDTSDGSYKINTSAQDAQTMCEILEYIKAETKKEKECEQGTDSPCSCAQCPYKEKLEKITSSLCSAVPDTTVTACNMPVLSSPTHLPASIQSQPVVSTDVIDGAMGGLFDMNMLNSFAQLQNMNSGLNVVPDTTVSHPGNMNNQGVFTFPNAFGEFNPLTLFASQQAI